MEALKDLKINKRFIYILIQPTQFASTSDERKIVEKMDGKYMMEWRLLYE